VQGPEFNPSTAERKKERNKIREDVGDFLIAANTQQLTVLYPILSQPQNLVRLTALPGWCVDKDGQWLLLLVCFHIGSHTNFKEGVLGPQSSCLSFLCSWDHRHVLSCLACLLRQGLANFVWSDLKPWAFCFCFPSSWDYRQALPHLAPEFACIYLFIYFTLSELIPVTLLTNDLR
jgi:hypothetical protein